MIHEILYKYFHGKSSSLRNERTFKELEEITHRLIASSSNPEYSLMQVLIELSENGVIGLDKDGKIMFLNYSASKFIGKDDIKGKLIFEVLDDKNSQIMKEFISRLTESNSTKIEVTSNNSSTVYDIVAYRVQNGKICYILFLVNCLERMMFKQEKCPLKENCPFNNKCNMENKK
jgi:signal transduction histidine kinase